MASATARWVWRGQLVSSGSPGNCHVHRTGSHPTRCQFAASSTRRKYISILAVAAERAVETTRHETSVLTAHRIDQPAVCVSGPAVGTRTRDAPASAGNPAGVPLPACRRRGRQGRQRAANPWRGTRQGGVCFFRRSWLCYVCPLNYRWFWLCRCRSQETSCR